MRRNLWSSLTRTAQELFLTPYPGEPIDAQSPLPPGPLSEVSLFAGRAILSVAICTGGAIRHILSTDPLSALCGLPEYQDKQ